MTRSATPTTIWIDGWAKTLKRPSNESNAPNMGAAVQAGCASVGRAAQYENGRSHGR